MFCQPAKGGKNLQLDPLGVAVLFRDAPPDGIKVFARLRR
jgi:hypothetical protein